MVSNGPWKNKSYFNLNEIKTVHPWTWTVLLPFFLKYTIKVYIVKIISANKLVFL